MDRFKGQLSDEQISEIKKVFSISDKDGDGTINANELGTIMTALADGAAPNVKELEHFMEVMDANGDGVISWEEFLSALTTWLAEPLSNEGKSRKRKATSDPIEGSPHKTRNKIHKKISSFFLQHRKETDLDSIRAKYQEMVDNGGGIIETVGVDPDEEPEDAKNKVAKLEMSLELLPHLSDIIQGLNGNNKQQAYECTKGLAELLAIVTAFRTPEERYEIGEFILHLFNQVAEAGVIPRIINFLAVEEMPELQCEAARVCAYFGPGPRIAHTEPDSMLYPARMLHKTEMINNGAHLKLGQLMLSPHIPCREAACLALGRLASHDPDVRNLFLESEMYPLIYEQIGDDTPEYLLRLLTWCLSIFCGHTHPEEDTPDMEIICNPDAQERMAFLFLRDDVTTLVHVANAMYYVLPHINLEIAHLQRFVQLITVDNKDVRFTVLGCLINLIRVDSDAIQALIQCDLLFALNELLDKSQDHAVRREACELIMVIAGEKGFVQAIIDSKMYSPLKKTLSNDEMLRDRVLTIFNYLTRGVPAQVNSLVEEDIIRLLANQMNSFKSYDSVLRDVYGYVGATYNFEYVQLTTQALDNILDAGELHNSSGNPFLRYFDLDIVDKIRTVLFTLSDQLADEMDAWRSSENGVCLEDQLQSLLQKILQSHNKYQSNLTEPISKEINDVFKQFEGRIRRNKATVERKRKQKVFEQKKSLQDLGGVGSDKVGQSLGIRGNMNIGMGMGMSSYGRSGNSSSSYRSSSSSSYSSSSSSLSLASLASGDTIQIKCFLNGDNRVLVVPSDISYSDLLLRVRLKYNTQGSIKMQYEDAQNDKITIDSQDILMLAFDKWNTDGVCRLYLLDSNTNATNRYGGRGNNGGRFNDRFTRQGSSNDLNIPSQQRENKRRTIEDLSRNTHFSKKDLQALHKQFEKAAIDGLLNLEQFAEGMREIGQTDQVMIEQFFNAFDFDKDGFVDFRDFAGGLSVMHRGTMNERLQLAFKAYDRDGNGVIDRDELFLIIKSSLTARGLFEDDDYIRDLVEQSFVEADTDGNGALDFNEFKRAVLKHQIVVQSFWKHNI